VIDLFYLIFITDILKAADSLLLKSMLEVLLQERIIIKACIE